jgi:hypothetical protein
VSERDQYPAGVPCWVTNLQRDVPAARRFYEQLFGWATVGPEGVADDQATYAVGRLRGRDVAGIGTMPASAGDAPANWITEISVDNLEETADQVDAAGGTVVQSPVEFDEIGRLAVFTDPAGAQFCAWQPGLRQGAQLVNEPGAWSMSALQTTDLPSALRFYQAVFGWQAEDFGPVTLFRLPGYFGGEPSQPVPRDVVAVALPGDDIAAARWIVDFWVADADAAVEIAQNHGGQLLVPPYDALPFRQSVLADAEGASFTVSQLTR